MSKQVDPVRSERARQAYFARQERIKQADIERRRGTIWEDGKPLHIILIVIVIGGFLVGTAVSCVSAVNAVHATR